MGPRRRRLDSELVRRGLVSSRARAQELVAAGRVTVAGAPAGKAARLVAADEPVIVLGAPSPYVGRGGHKLEAALDRFDVAVAGRRVLDVGASTGGFTDCLLQRGAATVWAVDVGHGQLHPRIRHHPAVVVREGCNVRDLRPADTGGPFDLTVVDVSFSSLIPLASALVELTDEGGDVVALVKPQFEVGRVEASRGKGVVRDPALWLSSLEGVAAGFARAGAAVVDAMPSPLTGGEGNVEFFLHLDPHLRRAGSEPGPSGQCLAAAVAEVVT